MKSKFIKILKDLKVGQKNKVRLKKKNQHIDIWWETRDKYFLNIKTNREAESYWIIKPDAIGHLEFLYPDFEKIN